MWHGVNEPDSWNWPDDPMENERFTGVTYTNPSMSALSAGQKFARTMWDDPREIAEWQGGRFRLVDGTCWYEPRLVANGWEIWRIDL